MALGVDGQAVQPSLRRTLLDGGLWVAIVTSGATMGSELIKTAPHRTTEQERCVFIKAVLDDPGIDHHLDPTTAKRTSEAAAAALIGQCLEGKRP